MRVLDLYCGEGGAAAGYLAAGATLVVGVDLQPTTRYPGTLFIQQDVLHLRLDFLRQFDLIHASPPCQFGTEMNNDKSRHLNLIPATRWLCKDAGVAYVLENVRAVAPHLVRPVSLFGTMFGNHLVTAVGQRFELSRERCFETNWGLRAPLHRPPEGPIANVIGGHLRCRSAGYRTGNGADGKPTGRTVDFPGEDRAALARQLMGMPWATMNGMSEAVPPSYTRYIGEQFRALNSRAAA